MPTSPNSVDDHGEATVGILQHMADERRLSRAEEAGDDGAGHLGERAHEDSRRFIGGTRAMVFLRMCSGRSRQTVTPVSCALC